MNTLDTMETIQAAYAIPGNTQFGPFSTRLTDQGIGWIMARLGRGHETEAILSEARRLAGGTSLYGDASMSRYALEKHLGFWD